MNTLASPMNTLASPPAEVHQLLLPGNMFSKWMPMTLHPRLDVFFAPFLVTHGHNPTEICMVLGVDPKLAEELTGPALNEVRHALGGIPSRLYRDVEAPTLMFALQPQFTFMEPVEDLDHDHVWFLIPAKTNGLCGWYVVGMRIKSDDYQNGEAFVFQNERKIDDVLLILENRNEDVGRIPVDDSGCEVELIDSESEDDIPDSGDEDEQ